MAVLLRRTMMWFVILAVALASAYVGFQLAQGNAPAQIGHSVGIELTKKGGNVPPHVCYKPGPAAHNKHCQGGGDD